MNKWCSRLDLHRLKLFHQIYGTDCLHMYLKLVYTIIHTHGRFYMILWLYKGITFRFFFFGWEMIQMFSADFPKFSERNVIGAAAHRRARKLRVKEVKLIDDEAWARQFKEAREGVLFALRQRLWNGIRSPSSAIETCPSLPTRRWTIRAIDPDGKSAKIGGCICILYRIVFFSSFEITRLSRRRRKWSERYNESIKSQGHSNNVKFKRDLQGRLFLLRSKLIIYRYFPTMYTHRERARQRCVGYPRHYQDFPFDYLTQQLFVFFCCR